jgi:hypothetical protein
LVKNCDVKNCDPFTVSSPWILIYIEPGKAPKSCMKRYRVAGGFPDWDPGHEGPQRSANIDFQVEVDLRTVVELADRFGIALLAFVLRIDLVIGGGG